MGLRIVHILPSLLVAGSQRYVTTLACAQAAAGDEPAVIALTNEPAPGFAAELEAAGVPLVCLRKEVGPSLRAPLSVLRAVRRFCPDVVHTHGYTLVYGLPAHLLLGARSVHTLHAVMPVELVRGAERFYRLGFRAGVQPVAVGDAVAASCDEVFGLRPPVIDSPVDLQRFANAPSREQARQQLGLPADALVAVTVARMEPVKGVDIALEAVALAAQELPNLHWLVAGDGSQRPELEARVAELGLQERVHFPGVQRDVAPVLAAADLFLLTSRSEGLPLAPIEALSAGVPAIVTPVGGLPEVVLHHHGGLVGATSEPVDLAHCIVQLADPTLRERLSTEAPGTVLRFDAHQAARRYREVYQSTGTVTG